MSLLSDAALLLLSMEGKLYEAGDLKDEVREMNLEVELGLNVDDEKSSKMDLKLELKKLGKK